MAFNPNAFNNSAFLIVREDQRKTTVSGTSGARIFYKRVRTTDSTPAAEAGTLAIKKHVKG